MTFGIKLCVTFCIKLYLLLLLIGDNIDEETTNQQGEKSGKKGKRPKKKNVEVEEPVVVGKRCQRLHVVDDLLKSFGNENDFDITTVGDSKYDLI